MPYPRFLRSCRAQILPALLWVTLAVFLSLAAYAQKPAAAQPSPAKSPSPLVTNEFVQKEFGDSCSLLGGPPQFVADLDGDGVDDLLIVARCKNPMADQSEHGFLVVDPYDTFMGFGDPKITTRFGSDDPEHKGVCVLIIHGNGPDTWRSATPKAKFLLINLPFRDIAVKRLNLRKKTVLGIFMEETGEGENTTSVVFWDGKKYRYQPMGSTME